MDAHGKRIDATPDGEYADHGEVKIVMTSEQFRELRNRLDEVGDNGTPENWAAIDAFTEAFDAVQNDLRYLG